MPTDSHQTTREIAVSAGWFTIGAMWFVQAFLPWTASGTLSQSSAIDASTLIRSGAVASLAPPLAGWLLLVLPVVGLLLAATAFIRHPVVRAARLGSLGIALVVTTSLSHYLTGFQVTRFGPGALLAWLACTAFAFNLAARPRTPPS